MNTIKHKLEIEIKNLEVDDQYYTFDYTVITDGKKKKGHFESDYENGSTAKQWKKELEEGYALHCVLEDIL